MSLILFVTLFITTLIISRSFRVDKIPNGNKFNCTNCHTSVSGGPRNAFGKAVESRVTPGGFQDFWDSQLASIDSDGDGFTNGEELQDPNGTWRPGQPNPGNINLVSNPGDPNSKPNISSLQYIFPSFEYKLYNNYPNPFNPETIITFEIPKPETVSLTIYNINGELIKLLLNNYLIQGKYEILWNGKNDIGIDVPSGIYIYKIKAGHYIQSKKMILLRRNILLT